MPLFHSVTALPEYLPHATSTHEHAAPRLLRPIQADLAARIRSIEATCTPVVRTIRPPKRAREDEEATRSVSIWKRRNSRRVASLNAVAATSRGPHGTVHIVARDRALRSAPRSQLMNENREGKRKRLHPASNRSAPAPSVLLLQLMALRQFGCCS